MPSITPEHSVCPVQITQFVHISPNHSFIHPSIRQYVHQIPYNFNFHSHQLTSRTLARRCEVPKSSDNVAMRERTRFHRARRPPAVLVTPSRAWNRSCLRTYSVNVRSKSRFMRSALVVAPRLERIRTRSSFRVARSCSCS